MGSEFGITGSDRRMLTRLRRHDSHTKGGGGEDPGKEKCGETGRMLKTLEDAIHNSAYGGGGGGGGGSGSCEIEMSDTTSDTCRDNSFITDGSGGGGGGGGAQGQSTAFGGSGGSAGNGSSSSSSCCKGVLKRRVLEAGLRQSMR